MILLPNYKDKNIGILGLGKSGLSAANALIKNGATVFAWDDNIEAREKAEKLGAIIADFANDDFDIETIEELILAPGIPHKFPKPHPAATKAKAANIPYIGDIELFARAISAHKETPRIIAITGTNGKSTTTALIGHILKNAGKNVIIGGNFGNPVCDFEMLDSDGIYVLELSSYQLELTHSLPIDIAIWLNITPDHIERHGDIIGYIDAKKRIFSQKSRIGTAIISIDDEYSKHCAEKLKDWKITKVTVKHPSETGISIDIDTLNDNGKTIMYLDNLPHLRGFHNWQNAACSYAAAAELGIDIKDITNGITTFMGLEHRQELILKHNNIYYINDSKATNAEAAAKALESYENIYWIAGGRSKEGGLNGLEHSLSHIHHCYLIGEAAPEFSEWLDKNNINNRICGTLDKAVALAKAEAEIEIENKNLEEAYILLSPAAASFDQYTSFEARGDSFTSLVQKLTGEKRYYE